MEATGGQKRVYRSGQIAGLFPCDAEIELEGAVPRARTRADPVRCNGLLVAMLSKSERTEQSARVQRIGIPPEHFLDHTFGLFWPALAGELQRALDEVPFRGQGGELHGSTSDQECVTARDYPVDADGQACGSTSMH